MTRDPDRKRMMERAMFPLLGPLIAGGASLLGSIFSSDTSAQNTQAQIQGQQAMQQQSEQFNAQQADINRQFQSSQIAGQQQFENQMSSTAYQRASADMQKAGLNPAMMFGSGGPASTPGVGAASGSTASIGTPTVPMSQRQSPLAGLGASVDKVVSTANALREYDRTGAAIDNIHANTTKQIAEAATEAERPELVRDMVAKMANEMPISRLAGTSAQDILTGVNDNVRKWANIVGWGAGKASDAIAPIVSSAGALRHWMPQSTVREGGRQYDPSGSGDFNEFWKARTGFGG